MEIIHPQIQSFAEAHSSKEDELLHEIAEFTYKNHKESQMLSGHLQGKLLEMISCMIAPRRILEIGTFTGYSGLCLAKGLTKDGHLYTLELRDEDASIAQAYFDRSDYKQQITLQRGNALEIIPTLQEQWDLVFIDADKVSYIKYFNLVFPQLRKNGFILADNVFLHGEALEANPKGKSAKGIAAFNEFIQQRTDIDKMMITLRDGLYLIRKL